VGAVARGPRDEICAAMSWQPLERPGRTSLSYRACAQTDDPDSRATQVFRPVASTQKVYLPQIYADLAYLLPPRPLPVHYSHFRNCAQVSGHGQEKEGAAIAEDCLLLPTHPSRAQPGMHTPIVDTHTHLVSTFAAYRQKSATRAPTVFEFVRAVCAGHGCALSSTCGARPPCNLCGERSRTRPSRRSSARRFGTESSTGCYGCVLQFLAVSSPSSSLTRRDSQAYIRVSCVSPFPPPGS